MASPLLKEPPNVWHHKNHMLVLNKAPHRNWSWKYTEYRVMHSTCNINGKGKRMNASKFPVSLFCNSHCTCWSGIHNNIFLRDRADHNLLTNPDCKMFYDMVWQQWMGSYQISSITKAVNNLCLQIRTWRMTSCFRPGSLSSSMLLGSLWGMTIPGSHVHCCICKMCHCAFIVPNILLVGMPT